MTTVEIRKSQTHFQNLNRTLGAMNSLGQISDRLVAEKEKEGGLHPSAGNCLERGLSGAIQSLADYSLSEMEKLAETMPFLADTLEPLPPVN